MRIINLVPVLPALLFPMICASQQSVCDEALDGFVPLKDSYFQSEPGGREGIGMPVYKARTNSEGDEKIEETKDKIKEEAEKAKEEERKRQEEKEEEEEEEEEDEGSPFFELLFWYFIEYASKIRFADYPYEGSADYYHNTSIYMAPEKEKIISLQLASDASYHFDETYAVTNRITGQITGIHANLFQQTIFSASESFSVVSLNGGLSFFLQDFILSGFVGFYKLNFLDDFLFSFGFMLQLFLPANFYIDFYNLNAVLIEVPFTHLAVSLNYAFWRFSIGLGYNFNKFVDVVYDGPCIKICFWL
jgi:hypothetical protein